MGNLADGPPAPKARLAKQCYVGQLSQALDDEDRAVLSGWLADPAVRGTDLARHLTDAGHPISPSSITRHRNGLCAC